MTAHDCPGRCGRPVPHAQLACKPCWFRLPAELRDEVNQTYRVRMRPGNYPAYRRALVAAFRWYRENPIN